MIEPSASEAIKAEAQRLLREANASLDGVAGHQRVTGVVRRLVEDHQKLAAAHAEGYLAFRDPEATIASIVGDITGKGALEDLVNMPGVEDIFFEGARVTCFVGGRIAGMVKASTEEANRAFINGLLAGARVALDEGHPVVHGVRVLGGRGRLAVAIPPATDRLSADLRIFSGLHGDLGEMVNGDTLSGPAAEFLRLVVRAKGSGLIGGETGSRKSTLLAALLREAHPNSCVRLVEESIELRFEPAHGGRYQVTGAPGAASLSDLIRLMLRMRPDIIAVGEVRGAESWDLAAASSVGAGFWATIHSRSAEGSLRRLIQTALMAGQNIGERLIRDTFTEGLDVVVHCEREDPNLLRPGQSYTAQVTEIRALCPSLDAFSSDLIFTRKGGIGSPLLWTGQLPTTALVERLERLLPEGHSLAGVLGGTL